MTFKIGKELFKVDDVTSVSKEEEKKRQCIAQAKSDGRRNTTDHDPGESLKLKRTTKQQQFLKNSIDTCSNLLWRVKWRHH